MKKCNSLQWIYSYSKKYILAVISLSIISALIAVSFIGLALLSKQVIDIATGKLRGNILFYCMLFIGTIAFQAVLNVVNSNIRIRASGKIEINIRQGLFKSLLQKQMIELNKYHSGEYVNRFTSDIEIVVDGVVSILPQAISMAVKLIFGLAVLIYIDVLFTASLIACGMLVFMVSYFYRKKFKNLHKEVQKTDGKTRSFIQECIENIIVIKSFISEKPVISKLKNLQTENYRFKIKRNTVSNLANTGVYVLFAGGYYFILIWGALQISSGKMTFGVLTAFLQVFNQVKQPFKNISGLIPQYFSMTASAERLQEIENLKCEAHENTSIDIMYIYEKMNSIKFSNVSFKYDEEMIFDNASISLKKGELAVIVGSSGAGKSTLMRLLLGLITVDEGKIYIETDEENYKIDSSMRKLFSYVPQGNMILSGTIRENVTFFNDSIKDEEVMNACRNACVMDFVSELPEGLDTIVGERGMGLSEGQIQRIAIARAIISNAPILLLDESTSALDNIIEGKLIRNLKNIANKTCIFVSHRKSTIAGCDRIIKIENNKIWEDYVYG